MEREPHTQSYSLDSDANFRASIPFAAIGAAIGSLAFGPGTQNYDQSRTVRSFTPPPIEEILDTAAPKPKESGACTSIRKKPNDIYIGYACAERGDFAVKVEDGYKEKGWVYSAVAVQGIYKCGFVREGALPSKQPRPRSVSHCKNYYDGLVHDRFKYFRRYNCPEIKKGLEGCRDGTYFTRVKKSCHDRIPSYKNFASDNPSPLNVFGTGDGGFSEKIKENKTTSVRYRVEFRYPTQNDHKAAVVRAPEWGLKLSRCIPLGKARRGGTKTQVTR